MGMKIQKNPIPTNLFSSENIFAIHLYMWVKNIFSTLPLSSGMWIISKKWCNNYTNSPYYFTYCLLAMRYTWVENPPNFSPSMSCKGHNQACFLFASFKLISWQTFCHHVVVIFREYVSDLGGTTGVMDQEGRSCRRPESFGACRVADRFGPGWSLVQTLMAGSGYSPATTGNRIDGGRVHTRSYRLSFVCTRAPTEARCCGFPWVHVGS